MAGFALFAALLSAGFLADGLHSPWSALSGDQVNILTICASKDHPGLLNGDMFVGNPRNGDYYIPAFVLLVRWSSLPDHDYLRGLSILLFLTSIVYLWGWFLLFSIWGNRRMAALLAFLARGVLWVPGNEMWGIAGLWSMLPRTLFLALLPWALWVWLRRRATLGGWVASAALCGLLVNIHPISGAGLVLAILLAEAAWVLSCRRGWREAVTRVGVGAAVSGLAMAPYVYTWCAARSGLTAVNPADVDLAVAMRIKSLFRDPLVYATLWLRPEWLALLLAPWFVALLTLRRDLQKHGPLLGAMCAFAVGCLIAAFAPFAVERLLRARGAHPQFAYEMVRDAKYLLVPTFVVGALAASCIASSVARSRLGAGVVCAVVGGGLLLTAAARQPIFNGVPILGDDVCRLLWPNAIPPPSIITTKGKPLDGALAWIRANTFPGARFVGPSLIRPAALRPVIHDFAAVTMLVQSDPAALVRVAKRERDRRQVATRGADAEANLLREWGAQYWVTRHVMASLQPAFDDGFWRIYDLRTGS